MEVTHETKKISIDPKTGNPEVTVAFTLGKIIDIEPFRKEIVTFQNELKGQQTLKK